MTLQTLRARLARRNQYQAYMNEAADWAAKGDRAKRQDHYMEAARCYCEQRRAIAEASAILDEEAASRGGVDT